MAAPAPAAVPTAAAAAPKPPPRDATPLRHELRAACAGDVAALASLSAAALDYNPAFDSVFALRRDDPAAHAAALRWLLERRIALLLRAQAHDVVAVDAESGALLGGAAVVRRARKAGLWDMLQVGLLEWPFRFGFASLQRALALDALAPEDPPGAPPFEGLVSTVAVAPHAQGRGVGSALLRALLREWDAAGGGALALDTQRDINVPFYERLGFTVTRARSHVGAHGVPNDDWAMRREAQHPAAA